MKPLRRSFAVLFTALGTLALTSLAEAADAVFTVAGVNVDATADNATEARQIAHREGRRKAMQILLHRMTLKDDWPNLPLLDDETLANMESGIEINNERRSQDRYLASITYSFIPERVRALLARGGISYSESQARPMLVLPVIEENGRINLWDEPNPWFNAWAERKLSHELVPIEAPLRDLSDISSMTAQDALGLNWNAMERLARRYNRTEILVAHAVLSRDGEQALLDVTLTQVNETNTESLKTSVIGRLSSDYSAEPVPPSEDVFRRGVATSVNILNSAWKSLTLVDQNSVQRIRTTVRFTPRDGSQSSGGLKTWLEIRNQLEEVATIREIEVIALSAKGAEIDVTFLGSVDQLALNLGQVNLVLSGARGYWEIGWRGTLQARLEGLSGQRPQINRVDTTAQTGVFEPSIGFDLQPYQGGTPGPGPAGQQAPASPQPGGQQTPPNGQPYGSQPGGQPQNNQPYGSQPSPSGQPSYGTPPSGRQQPYGSTAPSQTYGTTPAGQPNVPPAPDQQRQFQPSQPAQPANSYGAGYQQQGAAVQPAQPHTPAGVAQGYGYNGGPRFEEPEPAPEPEPDPVAQPQEEEEESDVVDWDALAAEVARREQENRRRNSDGLLEEERDEDDPIPE